MTMAYTEETLFTQNTFTDWIVLEGAFNLQIDGAFDGTITVQRKFSKGATTAYDVASGVFTSPGDYLGNAGDEANVQYRAGFKTGEYTSGSPLIRLSQ